MDTAVGLRRALHKDRAAGLFFLAATTLALGFLLVAASRQWFAQDDWGYLLWRDALGVDRGTMAQYMEPHNGHWVAVPVLIYYANRAVFGLSSYWPFVAPWIVFHLASVWLVRSVAIRSGVTAWTASVLGCILLVFGSGGEYLVFGPVTSWTIALTALFGQLVLIDVDGPVGRRDIAASALGLVGMMSSGFGVIFAVAIAVSLAIRRRWSALAVVVGPQLLAFTWWWATFGKDQAADQVPGSRSAAPDYAVRGISAAFDAFTAVPALSGVVMIGAASFGFALLHDVRCSATVWGLGAATVSLYIVLGVQRSGFGIEQAASPRYTMVGAMLLLPSIGLAVDRLRGWGPRPLAVAYVIAATSILVNLGRLQLVTEARGEAALQSKATYELVAGSPDFDSYDPKAIIDPHSENVTVGFIPWLVDHGMIEPRPATTSDEKATLAAIPRNDD